MHIAQKTAQLSFFGAEKELTGGSLLGLAGLYKPLADELEAQGKIRILEKLPNGTYKAEVWFNGKWKKRKLLSQRLDTRAGTYLSYSNAWSAS